MAQGDVQTRAHSALRGALFAAVRSVEPDLETTGYVSQLDHNLVSGVTRSMFEQDYAAAAGHELDSKMRSAHSSSALVVNTFAPWKGQPGELELACWGRFNTLQFEAICPTGLSGTPPHLDLLADGGDHIVAVESKCTEYLGTHKSAISPSYEDLLAKRPELNRVVGSPTGTFECLDALQLVKHALGLTNTYPGRLITLLYLFWEPANWRQFPVFARHRSEVQHFAQMVQAGPVRFVAGTYSQLWDAWTFRPSPPWLALHVDRLRARYDVEI